MTASFRDPAGVLFPLEGRILRLVHETGIPDLQAFLASKAAAKFLDSGRVARTTVLSEAESLSIRSRPDVHSMLSRGGVDAAPRSMLLEHERVWFPSYPYEWAPEMLHAAARLTLDLARELLADGVGLKDGTPYNVLFRGPEPVFIDLLSFERRDPGDSTWLPYAQFVRTFLLPLLATKHFGMALDQILTTRRDGLEPEEVYRWSKPSQRLRPPFFGLVSMPTWLASGRDQDDASIYKTRKLDNPEKARFILENLLNGLDRALTRLEPVAGKSTWSSYMVSNNNYSSDHFAAKQGFVEQVMREYAPKRVADIGCNTGHFSAIAARSGAQVVALDYDPVVVGSVWRNARTEKLPILPLVVNLTRPTPGIGWRNQECSSFLDRARGGFDAIFMLAVIHHMLVTERVPVPDILDLAAELTSDLAVIEFIAPEDSMFKRLTRGRDELHRGLTTAVFEAACRRHFEIVRTQHLENTSRWLYLLRKVR
ncbi:MAG: class I SAM-dependent methyltransferase [Bryobacteraceae bacterium]